MDSPYFLYPWSQHLCNYLIYIIFLSKALVHISENFQPPWKWLLEYFISRLSFRAWVDIHVSSYQSFIHKTLCSAEQFSDNVGNQKKKKKGKGKERKHPFQHLISLIQISSINNLSKPKNFISLLSVSYFLKSLPSLMKWEFDMSQEWGTIHGYILSTSVTFNKVYRK